MKDERIRTNLMTSNELRAIPSVDRLLHTNQADKLISEFGRPLTLESIRIVLAAYREEVFTCGSVLGEDIILNRVAQRLVEWSQIKLTPVINATGVVLHTNLGRAPLSSSTVQAIQSVAQSYSNLEYNLDEGERGSRMAYAEKLLIQLTGAEAGLVVNNNAAALLLTLSALAKQKRVIISRTQLIEIGGGFRLLDVLEQSGASLVEIGATNQVHLGDYQSGLNEPTGLVLYAHLSNFKIIGYSSQPSLREIIETAHQAGVPLIDDLGSGTLLDTSPYGIQHEPTVQENLAMGADLVCFSGDKLLGGPQAGIIVGRSELIKELKKHPLARAVRADKLCLAGICATLTHYLKDEAEHEIPIWQMISAPLEEIRRRVELWQSTLNTGQVISGLSTIGGGSLPGETIPTFLLSLKVDQPDLLVKRLRENNPPIIARILEDQVVVDPRTVLPFQEGELLSGIRRAL
jgi:L-seryl-tRNA(Ser) seleniumtransferase